MTAMAANVQPDVKVQIVDTNGQAFIDVLVRK
jgi:hypothetical protein